MTTADKIAALEREVAALRAAVGPAPIPSEQDAKEWASQMHAMRERRASQMIAPEVARDWNVIPDDVVKGITTRDCHAPIGPSGAGASGAITKVSSNVGLLGSNTGWSEATPLRPPPGVAQADRLMDAQDRRDREELAQRLGALKR